ncbi:MAG: acylphosphatase [Eubacteriaceae bacterium]|nr:acylphosphatase [Eubacteriaceae bacterium]
MKRLLLIVEGIVQGVGYRWFVKELAYQLKITGTVQNNYDSTVEIHAQGSEENLKTFIKNLYEGPNRFARVDNIRVEVLETEEGEKDFQVIFL